MKRYNNVKGWTVSLYTDEGQNNDRSVGYEYLCFINYKKSEEEEKGDFEEDVPHYSISYPKERDYDASSMSEYIDAMINISRQSSGALWYRGVCNSNFSLIPKLLREGNNNLSLYAKFKNI